ncbi:MAG: hypothetical protein HGA99_02345 [Chlorobiaceae bacterium]|nr:hypothetical protein [Chlorobiaceae bacterium]
MRRKKIKILLVRLIGDDIYDSNTADYNVGLAFLSDIAKKEGAIVALKDPVTYIELIEFVSKSVFDIVGMNVHYLNIVNTLKAAKYIKENNQSYIIMGGHHVSAVAHEILEDNKYIDSVCVGEGEDVFRRLITQLQNSRNVERGVLYSEKFFDINSYELYDDHGIDHVRRLSTSRGCLYSCSFCTTPAIHSMLDGPKLRSRNSKLIVNDITNLVGKGANKIYFNDDTFVYKNKESYRRAYEISEGLKKNNICVHLKIQLRADSFDYSSIYLLRKMRQVGFDAAFVGIESGSDNILYEYNKKTNNYKNIECVKTFDICRVQLNVGTILASPDSTVFNVIESINGLKKMCLAYMFFRRVTFRMNLFPGTEIERRLIRENRVIGEKRYLPRKYIFKDSQVERIVDVYEKIMPKYLHDIGDSIFKLRSRLIYLIYMRKVAREKMNLLFEWSDYSANMLIMHFQKKSNYIQIYNDMEKYTMYCVGLSNVIDRLIGDYDYYV